VKKPQGGTKRNVRRGGVHRVPGKEESKEEKKKNNATQGHRKQLSTRRTERPQRRKQRIVPEKKPQTVTLAEEEMGYTKSYVGKKMDGSANPQPPKQSGGR